MEEYTRGIEQSTQYSTSIATFCREQKTRGIVQFYSTIRLNCQLKTESIPPIRCQGENEYTECSQEALIIPLNIPPQLLMSIQSVHQRHWVTYSIFRLNCCSICREQTTRGIEQFYSMVRLNCMPSTVKVCHHLATSNCFTITNKRTPLWRLVA